MTAKLDGTNGLLQNYDLQVLTTGFSYTFAAGTQILIINPAGTLATGTITMPASPVDGMTITIESTQQVTAVTVQGNTGQSIVGAPAQLIPNQPLSFIYRATGATWYPFSGGAGRASALVSSTAVASTSGTSIDFTGIPPWVKRITVNFNGVSLSSSSSFFLVQIGSGSFVTTGYTSGVAYIAQTNTVNQQSSSAGFAATNLSSASTHSGTFVLTLLSSNTWIGTVNLFGGGWNILGAGNGPALSGALDRVRVTTSNGTDTFDAGTINILYE